MSEPANASVAQATPLLHLAQTWRPLGSAGGLPGPLEQASPLAEGGLGKPEVAVCTFSSWREIKRAHVQRQGWREATAR